MPRCGTMDDEMEPLPAPATSDGGVQEDSGQISASDLLKRLKPRRTRSENGFISKRTKGRDDEDDCSGDPSMLASRSSGKKIMSTRMGPARSSRYVSHGAVSLIGRRREMEDAVTVAPAFAATATATATAAAASASYDFFGVYDGHGGIRVAEACRDRLHVAVAEEVAGGRAEGRWREAMVASFSRVDGELSWTDKGSPERSMGSTAVVAVVGPRRIVVANCGDSRAVLSRGGAAVPLSSDHKPDRPDEMERVEAAGGKVINWNGYRVLGVVATSRSIGDYYLKPFVSSEPEVTITERTPEDEFLILASDGLWDVISNDSACKIARRCLTGRMAKMFPEIISGRTPADAAAALAGLAISKGSSDNITVVVVGLQR